MGVIEVLTFEIKPGRLDNFLADVRQLEQVLARVNVGLTGMRVLRYMVAGADSGRVALTVLDCAFRQWYVQGKGASAGRLWSFRHGEGASS